MHSVQRNAEKELNIDPFSVIALYRKVTDVTFV